MCIIRWKKLNPSGVWSLPKESCGSRLVLFFICLLGYFSPCKNCLSLAQNSFLWWVEQPSSRQHHHNFCVRNILPQSTKVRFLFRMQDFPVTSGRSPFTIAVTGTLMIKQLLWQKSTWRSSPQCCNAFGKTTWSCGLLVRFMYPIHWVHPWKEYSSVVW